MNRGHVEAVSRHGVSWYPAAGDRIVATMLGDVRVVLDTRDFSVTPHLVLSGFWESWITSWFLRNLSKGADRLLNIGANCGYYALAAARAGVDVVAVEPQSNLVSNLRISAMLNGWQQRLRVEECVAGCVDRSVTMQVYPDFLGSQHVIRGEGSEHPDLAGGTSTAVERPAHELMPDATCVFIDAEGYEPYIWKGLKPLLDKRQLRWVALEWAPVRYDDAAGFAGELRSYGELFVIDTMGNELSITDDRLLSGEDWDTVVVRPR